jgi:hypothetical protein
MSCPNQGKGIAAQAVGGRLNYHQGRGRGDGGIDGITASLEHPQAGLGGQRLADRHQTIGGDDRRWLRGEGI